MPLTLHVKKHPANYIADTDVGIFQTLLKPYHPRDELGYRPERALGIAVLNLTIHDITYHIHYLIRLDYPLYNIHAHIDLVVSPVLTFCLSYFYFIIIHAFLQHSYLYSLQKIRQKCKIAEK